MVVKRSVPIGTLELLGREQEEKKDARRDKRGRERRESNPEW